MTYHQLHPLSDIVRIQNLHHSCHETKPLEVIEECVVAKRLIL